MAVITVQKYRKPYTLFTPIALNYNKRYSTLKEAIDKDYDSVVSLQRKRIGIKPLIRLDKNALCYLIRKRNQILFKESGDVFTEEKLWEVFIEGINELMGGECKEYEFDAIPE